MSEFEDRLTRDLADLAHHRVASKRPIPPLPRPTRSPGRTPRRSGRWWTPVLAAALVVLVVGGGWALTRSSGKDGARPAVTDSVTPSPSPSLSPSESANLTSTPSPTPSVSVPSMPPPVDPAMFRFDGVGPLRLGMSVAEVEALGYSGGSISTFGCAQYFVGSPERPLSVIVDPVLDRVKSVVTVFATADYRTEAGIRVGSTAAEVRAAYAGYEIVEREFGQASTGLLVTGAGGFMGFTIKDGLVSSIKVADEADFATNSEVSCAAVTGNGQDPYAIRFGGVGSVDLGMSTADLGRRGYRSGVQLTNGCVQFDSAMYPLPGAVVDPRRDQIVALTPDTYSATEAGIKLGSTAAQVLAAYAGYQIQDLRGGMFGQGGDGIVVTTAAGSLGFATVNDVVTTIRIGEGDYATGREVGCG